MKKLILFSISIIFLISCERDVDFDLPYKEQVVISSLLIKDARLALNPNYIYSYVHIGKTIPPLDKADTNNALVKDAKVRIINNDIVYNLTYAELGFWLSEGFIPKAGETYRIEVDYKGKTTSAETYIPNYNFQKLNYEKEASSYRDWDGSKIYEYIFYINLNILTPQFAFLKSNSFDNGGIKQKYYDYNLYTNSKYSNNIRVNIHSISFYDYDLKDTLLYPDTKIYYSLDFFDPAFEKYWDTQNNGNEESGIFGGGGGLNIEGNIKNGLGYFYGSNPKVDSLIISF